MPKKSYFFLHWDYTLSEAWSEVDRADLMAAQGTFGTDFYDRSILRTKHCAYYRYAGPVIKIGPKCALGSHPPNSLRSTPRTEYTIVRFFIDAYLTIC